VAKKALLVLMVHDCAFVGRELREAVKSISNDVHVESLPYPLQTKLSVFGVALKIRRINPDIVHVHYCRYPAYATLLSFKPYIVHCHGTDIRNGINSWQMFCLRKARKVLVSTPDLLEILPNAKWLPNPINQEHFKPLKEHYENKVLYFPKWYENIQDKLNTVCKKLGYVLTLKEKRDIPYEEMPIFLNQFDIYVDRFTIKSYSKTALEAMACGLAVIGYKHDLKEALKDLKDIGKRRVYVSQQKKLILSNHERGKVAANLVEIYRQVYKLH
jgi:hypothetical protein